MAFESSVRQNPCGAEDAFALRSLCGLLLALLERVDDQPPRGEGRCVEHRENREYGPGTPLIHGMTAKPAPNAAISSAHLCKHRRVSLGEQIERRGDGDKAADDGYDPGSLNPHGAVEARLKAGDGSFDICFGGQRIAVGGHRATQLVGDRFSLLLIEASFPESPRRGERIVGGGVHAADRKLESAAAQRAPDR